MKKLKLMWISPSLMTLVMTVSLSSMAESQKSQCLNLGKLFDKIEEKRDELGVYIQTTDIRFDKKDQVSLELKDYVLSNYKIDTFEAARFENTIRPLNAITEQHGCERILTKVHTLTDHRPSPFTIREKILSYSNNSLILLNEDSNLVRKLEYFPESKDDLNGKIVETSYQIAKLPGCPKDANSVREEGRVETETTYTWGKAPERPDPKESLFHLTLEIAFAKNENPKLSDYCHTLPAIYQSPRREGGGSADGGSAVEEHTNAAPARATRASFNQ